MRRHEYDILECLRQKMQACLFSVCVCAAEVVV